MAKFYAVKVGKVPGVYNTWTECEMQVKGFSGAIYKSFTSQEEARDFLDETNKNSDIEKKEIIQSVGLLVYVDGSYSKNQKKSGYGCVFVENGEVIHKISKEVIVKEDLWNVSAEIEGVLGAIEWSIQNSYKNLTIYHDYIGLSHWADGTWKAKKETTKNYVEKINALSKEIDLKFIKVKAHSNDVLNDLADELAKKAIGILSNNDSEVDESNIIKEGKIKSPEKLTFETYLKIVGADFSPKFAVKYGQFVFNDESLKKISKYFYRKYGNKIKDLKEYTAVIEFPYIKATYLSDVEGEWSLNIDFGGQD